MAQFTATGTGTTYGSSYTLILNVNETSVDTTNNKSTVSWSLYLNSGAYKFNTWGMSRNAYINGELVYSDSSQISIGTNSSILLASGTKEISHDSDGTKTISCSATLSSDTSYYYLPGYMSLSGTMSLTSIARTPTISISKVSSTSSTITIKCSVTNSVSPTNYRVYSGSTVVATSTNSTITLTGLTSSTKYTIKAQGYANGSWGSDSNILYITTSSTSTISSIGDFTLDGVDIELSNSSGESSDIVVLIDGVEILRREGITSSSYSLVLTDEEKQTIYELIGNNSSISAVIRVESPSGEYNDYDTSITLSGDVFSCKINVDGTIKRGKVWVGTSSGNKQGIFCVGTSTGYVRGN